MGKVTRTKQQEREEREQAFATWLAQKNKKQRERGEKQPAELVTDLLEFKGQFIRSPDTFKLKTKSDHRLKQIMELVRHVFHRYPVPAFMAQAWAKDGWVRDEVGKHSSYRQWYVCIATGGSLYKEYTKNVLTKKETHLFLNCRYDLEIKQVLVFAVAKAQGGQDGAALRVAQSKLQEKPLTEFWKQCMRFFVMHPCELRQMNDLVDYVEMKHRESAAFSMMGMGHTIESLHRKMLDWHYDLRRLKAIGDARWVGAAIPDAVYQRKDEMGNDIEWHFKQITSTKALQEEGNAQRHCVFGYKALCIAGSCSIWSLQLVDAVGVAQRKVTIELSREGRIVQARGLANRGLRNNEHGIIAWWAREKELSFSTYY